MWRKLGVRWTRNNWLGAITGCVQIARRQAWMIVLRLSCNVTENQIDHLQSVDGFLAKYKLQLT